MNPFAITAQLSGLDEPVRRLKRVGDPKAQRRVMRRALVRGVRPVLSSARALAPVDPAQAGSPGLYRRSLGVRYAEYGAGVFAFVGPRHGFRALVRRRLDGRPVYQDPAKIGHLVERGHGGPAPAPPHEHLRPAWDRSRGQAESAVAAGLAAGVLRESGAS